MPVNHIPFSLGALHAFEAAARLGSFKAAAAELSLSATAISHRIRTLEAQLGKALFERRTRAVVLTVEGRVLAEAVSSGFAAIAQAAERIRRPERRRVVLALTPEFAARWLVPRLAAFQAACPDVELHIRTDYRPTDLAAGEADLAVRYGGGTRYSDAGHLIQAALAGQGVALLGRSLLAEEFRLGLLQSVSDIILPGQPYYLCRTAGVVLSPAVRAVVGWWGGCRKRPTMTAARFCRNAAAVFNQKAV